MAKNLVNGTNIVVEENGSNINMNLSNDMINLINGIKGEVLWTNPNPSSDITTLEINLSNGDYDILEVYTFQSTTSQIILPSLKIIKGYDGLIIYSTSTLEVVGTRRLSRINNTKYNLDTYFSVLGGGGESGNRIIPYKIIGYKNGLL